MKTLVTIVAGSLLASSAFAQGLLNWSTSAAAGSTIKYSSDPFFGASAGLVYDGTKGSPLLCGVWIGAAGSAESSLAFLSTSQVTIGTAGPSKGNVTGMAAYSVPGYVGGSTVTLQVRAWDAAGTVIGRSGVTQLTLGGPAPNPAAGTWSLTGVDAATSATSPAPVGSGMLKGFTLVQVPEPTTAAIAGLGVAAMLIFRRKK